MPYNGFENKEVNKLSLAFCLSSDLSSLYVLKIQEHIKYNTIKKIWQKFRRHVYLMASSNKEEKTSQKHLIHFFPSISICKHKCDVFLLLYHTL